jgi:hypothetical protein
LKIKKIMLERQLAEEQELRRKSAFFSKIRAAKGPCKPANLDTPRIAILLAARFCPHQISVTIALIAQGERLRSFSWKTSKTNGLGGSGDAYKQS